MTQKEIQMRRELLENYRISEKFLKLSKKYAKLFLDYNRELQIIVKEKNAQQKG
jgi:hypothetical protein